MKTITGNLEISTEAENLGREREIKSINCVNHNQNVTSRKI